VGRNMREHALNELNNFISGYYMDDDKLVDDLISYHENSPHQFEGVCAKGVDKSNKDSIDVHLEDEELGMRYLNHVQDCMRLYIDKYNMCMRSDPFTVQEHVMIQRYDPPSGGFHGWHNESGTLQNCNRWLVFMTYLNDIKVGGETGFYYQNIKVNPRKGLTLIWTADWTHTHKGFVAPEETKYIVTGWYSLISKESLDNEKEQK
jgi:prolyl 4-hydroxylase